jgi:MFS family permease
MYVAWGRRVDTAGPHRVLSLSVFLSAWVWVTYSLAPSAWWLTVAYAISGLAFSGVQLSYLTSILSFAPKDKVHQYQAVHLTSMGVRGTIAPIAWPFVLRLMESIWGKGETALRASFLVPAAFILTGFALHRAWVCAGKHHGAEETQQENR